MVLIYKNSQKSVIKTTTKRNPTGNPKIDKRRHIDKHKKRCSSLVVVRDVHIKATLRFYYISIRMAKTNKWTDRQTKNS